MTEVRFYDKVEDGLLRFAVIIARSGDKWVFCKHRERNTYEVPGGHREPGENIDDTARRELYEETGALRYTLQPICVYSVTAPDNFDGQESFGMLYYAQIEEFEPELHSEIEKIILTAELPECWTYPEIQPKLLAELERRRILNNIRFEKLTPLMADDFLHYFENEAFPENDSRSCCFCLESHLPNESEYTAIEDRREKARELILKGIMTGYLIYDNNHVIGWCNTGDKTDYLPIYENDEFRTDDERGKVKVLYCIDIAPNYQGKGIANIIMEKVLSDAKEEGYSYVEGYPFVDTDFVWQYHGPVRLYEKYGFEMYGKKSWFYIMRKAL